MNEHTKGSWRVAMSTEDGVYVMCGKSVVAHVYDMGSGGENNRNIIAAAPDLLETLKGMCACFSPKPGQGVVIDCVVKAQAAIAKAEGRL